MSFLPVAIEIVNLWVVKGGGFLEKSKSILQDVNLEVEPGEFLGVVGPNGAGKTTLLKAMVGEKPAFGQIRLRQGNDPFESMYDNPEYWLQRIGYVPVDNVLHDDLTIAQALLHVGRLRLPGASDEYIKAKYQEKLGTLGFEADDYRFAQPIKTLSSGERKKVNIAAELLTDPPLLLLDEPTSNLDPNAERELMNNLRAISGTHMSGQGPTIVLITHTLESLDRCDKVAFIANSCLLAAGSPEEVFERLRADIPTANIPTESVDTHRFEYWAEIFDTHKTNETIAQRREHKPPSTVPEYSKAPIRGLQPDTFWRQFRILVSRYFALRSNDLYGMVAALVSGFVVGFLMLVAPSEVFLKPESGDGTAARQTVVLYTILVVIMGAFISHREISKEFRIYVHERTKGLDPLAYILSKGLWLAIVIGVLVTGIIIALSGLPLSRLFVLSVGIGLAIYLALPILRGKYTDQERLRRLSQVVLLVIPLFGAFAVQIQLKVLPEQWFGTITAEIITLVSLVLASFASLALGLLISAMVGGNNDRATQLVIAAILINVVLAFSALVIANPSVQAFFDRLEPLAATHWGYRGFASGISIYCWAGQTPFENFNSWGQIGTAWLLLLIHVVVLVALGVLALRLQETWISRRRLFMSIVQSSSSYVLAGALIALFSWAVFLTQQSDQYYQLTFYDRLDGRNRYARVENIVPISFFQQVNGSVSQSECGVDQIIQR